MGDNARSIGDWRCAAAAGALAWAFALAPASAQETRWTAPSGRFTLDIAGWRSTGEPVSPPEIVEFEPDETPERLPVRMCAVGEQALPLPGPTTQADLNHTAGQFVPRSRPGATISAPVVTTVDGVTVLQFRVEGDGFAMLYRMFPLVDADGNGTQNFVRCGGPATLGPEFQASIERLLNSLRFTN